MNRSLSFNGYIAMAGSNRIVLQRLFFSLALGSLLLNYNYHITLHQIGRNPILYQEIDPAYWLFMLLNLPDIISGRFSVVFDLLLVLSCCGSLLWPKQNGFAIAFFVLHFVYFILYNMMSGHHYVNVGLLFMSFPFIFSSDRNVAFAFLFMRFLFCFIMFTAALWKIGRGNLFHTEHLFALFMPDYVENEVSGNTSLRMLMVAWLLHHRYLVHTIWLFLILLETIFVAGFVTFKYDRFLLGSYLLFFIGGWLLFDIYNYENLLFLITLAPALQAINFFKSPYRNLSLIERPPAAQRRHI